MWWAILGAIVVVVLIYAYRDHTQHGRRLTLLFGELADKYGGTVKQGSVLAHPQLRFDDGNRRFFATAMANSGAHAVPSGPFTLVDLELPFDTAETLQIERCDARPVAEIRSFDEAFRVRANDSPFAPGLLDQTVREKLTATSLPKLMVRVRGAKISVHMDGIAESEAALQELIDIANLVADRCAEPQ